MSKVHICDFCERQKFIGIRLKVRGKRWHFLPGMSGAAVYKLELCDNCYDKMVVYIGSKTRGIEL